MSELSGKTQTQVIKKLIRGATIKEKPEQEFYQSLNDLIKLRIELKRVRDTSKFTRELDTKKINEILNRVDELRVRITENYLK